LRMTKLKRIPILLGSLRQIEEQNLSILGGR